MRILVKLPTRERPQRALATVREFVSKAARRERVRILVSVDDDDPAATDDLCSTLVRFGADVRLGTSGSKVKAINRDIDHDFDVLVVVADDMAPAQGWDAQIEEDMAREWPNLDGAIHYNDGHVGNRVCTIPVMGINLYRKFGYVYHPDYTSLYCDNEYTDIMRALGRMVYIDRVLIHHKHPTFGFYPSDRLLEHTQSFMGADNVVYDRRKVMVPAFGYPELVLSIGICSLRARTEDRQGLLESLNSQINASQPARIEVVLDVDGGEVSVGEKRQRILNHAKGRFIAFVDDDDMVADDYVSRVIAGIDSDSEADCLSLRGMITTSGADQREFRHSIQYRGYYEEGGVYFRTPNHLNPVRRSHALRIGFQPLRCGEDFDYATRMQQSGLLKREVSTGAVLYYYRFDPNKTATQR